MLLSELIREIPDLRLTGDPGVKIDSIVCDSRKAVPGSLFVAMRGQKHDGADYIQEALRKGAAALMLSTENPSGDKKLGLENRFPLIASRELRRDMALMACKLYGWPTKKLKLIGVTGTNGKTTTTYLVESILRAAGKKTGVIGTINYRSGRSEIQARQTTPESIDLQKMFRDMLDAGTEYCLLEVSSHALELNRISGSRFEACVFTNLSQDHLDFHRDMESYYGAKRKMFKEYQVGATIVNADDEWGRKLIADDSNRLLTYGIHNRADVSARDMDLSMDGSRFTLILPQGSFSIHSPLAGEYNVYNMLAASTVALSCGIDISHILEGVASLKVVPGRFQKIDLGQDFKVIVDYAHTEDALRKLLGAARTLCKGKLIALFGCGGDRDKGKRPLMGKAAAELSDMAVITSDNPRTEDPMSIIQQIEKGFLSVRENQAFYKLLPDRRMAIHEAIAAAETGDVVLIAGKGHEKHQIVGDERFPFDDAEEAGKAISTVISTKAH